MLRNKPAIVTIAPEQENNAGIFASNSAAKETIENTRQKTSDLLLSKKYKL